VGGDNLDAASDAMRDFGRIVCCRMTSGYNDEKVPSGPENLSTASTRTHKLDLHSSIRSLSIHLRHFLTWRVGNDAMGYCFEAKYFSANTPFSGVLAVGNNF